MRYFMIAFADENTGTTSTFGILPAPDAHTALADFRKGLGDGPHGQLYHQSPELYHAIEFKVNNGGWFFKQ
jgi:hypothetical protein